MGSSIRSYLWLCCGVFHQIPTLAGVLTSSGEGYKGSEGLMLCLHLSCLFLFSASIPVYLLCVVADCHGNACLFTVCVHVVHLHIFVSFRPLFYFLYQSVSLSSCASLHTHVHTCTCATATVCACDCWRPCGRGSEGWPVDTEP